MRPPSRRVGLDTISRSQYERTSIYQSLTIEYRDAAIVRLFEREAALFDRPANAMCPGGFREYAI